MGPPLFLILNHGLSPMSAWVHQSARHLLEILGNRSSLHLSWKFSLFPTGYEQRQPYLQWQRYQWGRKAEPNYHGSRTKRMERERGHWPHPFILKSNHMHISGLPVNGQGTWEMSINFPGLLFPHLCNSDNCTLLMVVWWMLYLMTITKSQNRPEKY